MDKTTRSLYQTAITLRFSVEEVIEALTEYAERAALTNPKLRGKIPDEIGLEVIVSGEYGIAETIVEDYVLSLRLTWSAPDDKPPLTFEEPT